MDFVHFIHFMVLPYLPKTGISLASYMFKTDTKTIIMTLYGTKVAKLIVEPIEHKCANCNTIHTMDMHVFQKYATILGVPFFPTNKTGVALCTHCMLALKRRQMTPELLRSFNKVKSHSTVPMWTWAGMGAVLLLLGVLFSSFVRF